MHKASHFKGKSAQIQDFNFVITMFADVLALNGSTLLTIKCLSLLIEANVNIDSDNVLSPEWFQAII